MRGVAGLRYAKLGEVWQRMAGRCRALRGKAMLPDGGVRFDAWVRVLLQLTVCGVMVAAVIWLIFFS